MAFVTRALASDSRIPIYIFLRAARIARTVAYKFINVKLLCLVLKNRRGCVTSLAHFKISSSSLLFLSRSLRICTGALTTLVEGDACCNPSTMKWRIASSTKMVPFSTCLIAEMTALYGFSCSFHSGYVTCKELGTGSNLARVASKYGVRTDTFACTS